MSDAFIAGPPRIAALPMYDWPEAREATDAFWSGWRDAMRARGLEAPDRLERARPMDQVWRDPTLLLAQTCGRPFAEGLTERCHLVATPVYAAEGCEGPRYASWIVARADAPERAPTAESVVAANSYCSFSGWSAYVRSAPTPEKTILTGSHRGSAEAVADGAAEFAAIDAVSMMLFERFEPALTRKLRRVRRTDLAPALPFIAARERGAEEIETIRAALRAALADPGLAEARSVIGLAGAEILPMAAYERMAGAFDPPQSRR